MQATQAGEVGLVASARQAKAGARAGAGVGVGVEGRYTALNFQIGSVVLTGNRSDTCMHGACFGVVAPRSSVVVVRGGWWLVVGGRAEVARTHANNEARAAGGRCVRACVYVPMRGSLRMELASTYHERRPLGTCVGAVQRAPIKHACADGERQAIKLPATARKEPTPARPPGPARGTGGRV